jgi:hypothetical protein
MPCDSGPPHPSVALNEKLNAFLDETHGRTLSRRRDNDAMARELCEWCKTHDVTTQSLELQIWWRDHQRHDAEREAREVAEQERQKLRAEALAKLTPAERKALLGGA